MPKKLEELPEKIQQIAAEKAERLVAVVMYEEDITYLLFMEPTDSNAETSTDYYLDLYDRLTNHTEEVEHFIAGLDPVESIEEVKRILSGGKEEPQIHKIIP